MAEICPKMFEKRPEKAKNRRKMALNWLRNETKMALSKRKARLGKALGHW
jgi:hypothetical protein